MKLHLLWIGKTAHPWIQEGILHYIEQIRHFIPVELRELKAPRGWRRLKRENQMEHEASLIIDRLPKGSPLVLADLHGRPMDSRGFAATVERLLEERGGFTCAVGGPFGIHERLRQRADHSISLSPLTFTHDLARLILTEQLYRALSIIHGRPYHY